jgi:UDP-N-acetylmuramoyl-tripeptide--D-alanyl-D-alanine ligase
VIEATLGTVARWLAADAPAVDGAFRGVSTDSRTLEPGQLFVALRGPSFDGHDYLQAALERGAAGALVSAAGPAALPQIPVGDTLLALGRLANAWRRQLELALVAITGSNGKTTVKEMTASILRLLGPTQQTRGNLNNAIGLPLTLLDLRRDTDYAVVEMGASAPGEIRYLTRLARPDVALVNNAGPAHLEGFGTIAGVARSKGEIFDGLANDGTAVFNGDDEFAPLWREAGAARKQIEFGFGTACAVRGAVAEHDSDRLTLSCGGERVAMTVPLPGRHNAMNALAASAAAVALGADLATVCQGIERTTTVAGRLTAVSGMPGLNLIDDSYNANPASLQAALAAVSTTGGERWLVLGDMAELGSEAVTLHEQAGQAARASGVQRLFGLGPLTEVACRAFGDGAEHHPSMASLLAGLRQALAGASGSVNVLVKGSRSMRMERVVEALRGVEVGA